MEGPPKARSARGRSPPEADFLLSDFHRMLRPRRAGVALLAGIALIFSDGCGSKKGPTDPGGETNKAPNAALLVSPVSGMAPLQVTLQLTCTDSDGAVTGYELDSTGDGQYDVAQASSISIQRTYSSDVTVKGRCRDNSGSYSSVQSRGVDVTPPPPPAAPTNLTAVAVSQTGIDLQWTDNSGDETGFHIERSPDGSSGWAEIGSVGQNATGYSDTGLANGTTYHYRVRANGLGGFSSYSNLAQATSGEIPPVAPTGLQASPASETGIDLAWTDNADNETAFHIERSADGSGDWTEIGTVGADVSSYSDSGLGVGATHFYRVRAYAPGGFSSYSNVASATTPVNPPAAPTNLGATSRPPIRIDLAWTDNADNETAFHIERSPDGVSGWAEIGTVGADGVAFSDTGLEPSTPYFYRVRAHRFGVFSDYSNVATATTPAAPPSGLVAAAISKDQIDLAWTDNAGDETAFHIERSPDGTIQWTEIGTVGADVTVFSSTGLTSNTPYFYRVRTLGPGGFSQYSNTATATTPVNLTSDVTFTFRSVYDEQVMRNGTSKIVWHEEGDPAGADSLISSNGVVKATLLKGVWYEIRAEHSLSIDDDQGVNYSVLVGQGFKVQRADMDESSLVRPRADAMGVEVWKLRDGVYDLATMDLIRNNFRGLTGTVRYGDGTQPITAFAYLAPPRFLPLKAEQKGWLDDVMGEADGLGLDMVYQVGIQPPSPPFFGIASPDSVFPGPLGGALFDSLTYKITYSGLAIPNAPVTEEDFKREFWEANFAIQELNELPPPILAPDFSLNLEARKAVVAILLFDPKTLFR